MKYIIKNCPALYINNNNEYDCDKAEYFCQDCTDCVMKRIVNECKADIGSKNNMFLVSRYDLVGKILELLEIEEVDEM